MRRLSLGLVLALAACGSSLHGTDVPDLGSSALADLAEDPHPYQGSKSDAGTKDKEVIPLVLAHGMSGFQNIGPLDYFYGVKDVLTADGHQVFVSVVDPFNSSEVRGAQLQAFIEETLKQTGAKRVKVIAHSQGGLDIRYAMSKIPDKIAAVVTISSPHHGSEIADVALDRLPGPIQDALEAVLNIFGLVLSGGSSEDARQAVENVSVEEMNAWNLQYPLPKGIAFYSIAGRSNQSMGDDACAAVNEPLFISRWHNDKDPINPLLAIPGAILEQLAKVAPTNDGLVTAASAHWGTFLGCIPADHLDEVCQIAGQSPGNGNDFNCHQFYRELAAFLVDEGF